VRAFVSEGERRLSNWFFIGALLNDRREREELSAIGALARYPIIPGRYVNYRT
jgi:hypothetical protein